MRRLVQRMAAQPNECSCAGSHLHGRRAFAKQSSLRQKPARRRSSHCSRSLRSGNRSMSCWRLRLLRRDQHTSKRRNAETSQPSQTPGILQAKPSIKNRKPSLTV
jgi:hypothetical protein